MYGKIFESIYHGSLHGDWETMVVFQQLIVLADQDGRVDMTAAAIASVTSMPVRMIEAGIIKLMEPDPMSRTQRDNGRRLRFLDDHREWGWQIVNHEYYRNLTSVEDRRRKEREKKRAQREKEKAKRLASLGVPTCPPMSPHTDTDTDTDTEEEKKQSPSGYSEEFQEFWSAFPAGRKTAKGNAWKAYTKAREIATAAELLTAAHEYAGSQVGQGEFVKGPAPWLNGRCWEDDREAWNGGKTPIQEAEEREAKGLFVDWSKVPGWDRTPKGGEA